MSVRQQDQEFVTCRCYICEVLLLMERYILFDQEQQIFILKTYIHPQSYYQMTRNEFTLMFPQRPSPNKSTISRLHAKFY